MPFHRRAAEEVVGRIPGMLRELFGSSAESHFGRGASFYFAKASGTSTEAVAEHAKTLARAHLARADDFARRATWGFQEAGDDFARLGFQIGGEGRDQLIVGGSEIAGTISELGAIAGRDRALAHVLGLIGWRRGVDILSAAARRIDEQTVARGLIEETVRGRAVRINGLVATLGADLRFLLEFPRRALPFIEETILVGEALHRGLAVRFGRWRAVRTQDEWITAWNEGANPFPEDDVLLPELLRALERQPQRVPERLGITEVIPPQLRARLAERRGIRGLVEPQPPPAP